jgi:crossover junction endodeoxyribonuclease RuvC
MSKIILGFDPGLKGGIGVIQTDGPYAVYDIPTIKVEKSNKKIKTMIDIEAFRDIMEYILDNPICDDRENVSAWVELVSAMPAQGVTSMFSMGRGLGNIEMLLTCFQVDINWVSPQKWKKEVVFGAGSDKLISVQKAKELFPKCEFETKRGRALDGRAESLLIAEYGRRQIKS